MPSSPVAPGHGGPSRLRSARTPDADAFGGDAARGVQAEMDPFGEWHQSLGNHAMVRLFAGLRVQTKVRDGSSPAPAAERVAPSISAGADTAAATPSTPASLSQPVRVLVVEDDATDIDPAVQMGRSEFLARLRKAICATTNEGLAATGRTADDCPWIEYWLGYYDERDAGHLTRSLQKFAPETSQAATAAHAVSMVATRVRRSVDRYARTGEVSGMPDVPLGIPGSGLLGGMFGSMLFKARPDGIRGPAPAPDAVRAELGAGQALAGDVRSRMDSLFGVSFSHVRVHTDGTAARLNHGLNARAFAVGEHIAFGGGEYRPGTVMGDALIAHELAHTIQQTGAGLHSSAATSEASLEREADRSAVAAVRGMTRGPAAPRPGLRSGLRLSRCSPKPQAPKVKGPADVPAKRDIEKPPKPEESFWFEDPKKQVKEDDGRTIDFTKEKKEDEIAITTTQQRRRQVFVEPRSGYSEASGVWVRFAYPSSEMPDGKPSTRLKAAKAAVLKALAQVVVDADAYDIGDIKWNNDEERKRLLARRKAMQQDRARMMELFKGFTKDKPMNIYLAPETEEELRAGSYIPTTAQVWVNMNDVGDPAKLTAAMRLPLHHVLGGPNAARGGAKDEPGDLKRTLIHESVHTLLLNRSADSDRVWKRVEKQLALTGSDEVQTKARAIVRAYILAQEELFAYNLEQARYPPDPSGQMISGKSEYEQFVNMVEQFFKKKGATLDQQTFTLNVSERAEKTDKRKVPWSISYKFPLTLTLEDKDKSVLDLAIQIWPLK